jgi:hypothetical protein
MNGAGRSRWRTVATLALAWVVIGFTINAAMVVALSQWAELRYEGDRTYLSVLVMYARGVGIERSSTHSWRHFAVAGAPPAPSWVDLHLQSPQPRDGQLVVGWPTRAATGWTYDTNTRGLQQQGLIGLHRLQGYPPVSYARPRLIPYIPLWRGVAINTLVLGSPALLLLLIPPVRASRRRRKGKCPRCAYDLKHDFARGCSECGWNKPPAEASER